MSYQSRIYLFRPDVETFSRAITVNDDWEQRTIECSEFVEVEFWIKPNVEAEPRWKAQFSETVDLSDINPNRQTSSVLLIKVDGRIFAECMGYGHSLLDKYWVEEDFGLVLASRFVSVANLRAVGIRTYGPHPTSTVVRSPKPGQLEAFVPNPVFSQLSLLDGMPNEERRAHGEKSRMEGNLGFKECSPFTTCDERVEHFRSYLVAYQRGSALPPAYVASQPKSIPTNHETSQELYAALLAILGEGRSSSVEIMLPDDMDAAVSGTDIYLRTGQRQHSLGELSWPAISAALGNEVDLSINRLNGAQLELRGSEGETMSVSLLSCIHFEVANGDDLFVHGNSGWMRFSRQLIQVLDSALDECEAQSNADELPSWDPQWKEGEYNRRVAREKTGSIWIEIFGERTEVPLVSKFAT